MSAACNDNDCPRMGRVCPYPADGCPANDPAPDARGCPPLLACTDRPELCPPACRPVIRNAGANAIPPTKTKGPA